METYSFMVKKDLQNSWPMCLTKFSGSRPPRPNAVSRSEVIVIISSWLYREIISQSTLSELWLKCPGIKMVGNMNIWQSRIFPQEETHTFTAKTILCLRFVTLFVRYKLWPQLSQEKNGLKFFWHIFAKNTWLKVFSGEEASWAWAEGQKITNILSLF